jgi:Fe-S oxidoreductase
MKAGERSLFPAIRAHDKKATVISDGTSCRQQIQDGTGVKAMHIVELIADLI